MKLNLKNIISVFIFVKVAEVILRVHYVIIAQHKPIKRFEGVAFKNREKNKIFLLYSKVFYYGSKMTHMLALGLIRLIPQ